MRKPETYEIIDSCRKNWGEAFGLVQEFAGEETSRKYTKGKITFAELKEIARENALRQKMLLKAIDDFLEELGTRKNRLFWLYKFGPTCNHYIDFKVSRPYEIRSVVGDWSLVSDDNLPTDKNLNFNRQQIFEWAEKRVCHFKSSCTKSFLLKKEA